MRDRLVDEYLELSGFEVWHVWSGAPVPGLEPGYYYRSSAAGMPEHVEATEGYMYVGPYDSYSEAQEAALGLLEVSRDEALAAVGVGA